MNKTRTILGLCGAALSLLGRSEPVVCGTNADRTREEMFLHRQAVRRHSRTAQPGLGAAARDVGNIALIDDSNGVVARRNPFDLNQKTLRFLPVRPLAASYRFEVSGGSYDSDAAAAGIPVKLGDDDSKLLSLPFAFPFFGNSYRQIYVNSDGNATFTAGDAGSTDRSFGRFTAGVPRIAALFADLDPTQTGNVLVTSEATRFVVTWASVPQYSQFGTGRPETFQLRLYLDGRIEIGWSDVDVQDAVVGIAPGRLTGASSVLSFTAGSTQEFSAAVGERFAGADSIDIVTAAQQFYASHDDAYDYLVIFNSEGLPAAPGAVAYEVTTRNQRTGYGDRAVDIGRDFGSTGRLQAVLNLGPLSQYPVDPNGIVPARFASRDTPLTIIGHEAGHLFLAYASVPDPNDPAAQPMLGRQLAHWSFLFNSEASLLEGNRIQDMGPDVSPRFATIATSQGYAPLDQYLMGFRAPEEVPPTFLVTDAPGFTATRGPQAGLSFDGQRRDITVQELIAAVGRRTPDSTMAQRRFRFAFLLVVPAGTVPQAGDLAQVETYRSLFENFYQQAASGRATAETSLKRALHLSAFPAVGLINGSMAAVTLSPDSPAAVPLVVELEVDSGAVGIPSYAIIPAGESRTSFFMMGLNPGVATLTARPVDSSYETAFARVQVADGPAALQVRLVSNTAGEIILKVTDGNDLPYPNTAVKVMGDGMPVAISDVNGLVRFSLSGASTEVTVSANGGPAIRILL